MKSHLLRILIASFATLALTSCGTVNRLLTTATAPVRMVTGSLLGDANEGSYGEDSPVQETFEPSSERTEIMAFTSEEVVPDAQ